MSRTLARTLFVLAVTALAFQGSIAGVPFTTVTLENPEIQDAPTRFGQILAIIGDVDGDGVPDVGVGVPFLDEGPPNEFGTPLNVGRAFLFSGASWTLLRTFDDPEFQEPTEDKFGGKLGPIAAIGDVNGDGATDFLVGVPFREVESEDEGEPELDAAGQAFVFSGADGTVLFTVDDPFPDEFSEFAHEVAAIGDLNGDGIGDVVLSAPFKEIDEVTAVGEVYLLSGASGSLIRVLTNPAPSEGSEFGASIAVADGDGDGIADVLVGAPGQGMVHVFRASDGALLRSFANPFPQTDARFGAKVDGGKDVTGDGVADVLVGSPFQDVGGRRGQGRVYLFSGASGSLAATLDNPSPQPFSRFGFAAALVRDVNGDGKAEVLAGAPDQDVAGLVNAGQAFLLSGADGGVLSTFDSPVPQSMASFGATIAAADLNGDGVVDPLIASPMQDVLHPVDLDLHHDQGLVFLFLSGNRAPVADAQSASTAEDGSVGLVLTGSDADGDVLTFTIASPPAHGSLSGTPPALTYTPFGDFTGSDSFTFHVGDGKTTSPDATVALSVTPVNDAPHADAGADQAVDEGTTVSLNGTASSDVDGDVLRFSWKQTAGPRVRLSSKKSPTPSFAAPAVAADTVLRFQLTVNDGTVSSRDTVEVTVHDTGAESGKGVGR